MRILLEVDIKGAVPGDVVEKPGGVAIINGKHFY